MKVENLQDKVSNYVTGFVSVNSGTSVQEAARTMMEKGTTEVLVVKENEPIGIVTEKDFAYRVVAQGVLPSAPVDRIMSAPIHTIDENSTVLDAIQLMRKHNVRRLAVTRQGKIIGIVSQKAIIFGSTKVSLPELSRPVYTCPYCDTVFENEMQLSKHIDDVHIGKGLLEGNVTKW